MLDFVIDCFSINFKKWLIVLQILLQIGCNLTWLWTFHNDILIFVYAIHFHLYLRIKAFYVYIYTFDGHIM